MAWYKEWFGEEYLELYSHRDAGEAEEHIAFVERVFEGPRPVAVLDLACGAGRHTEALRRRGWRALGVDLSLTLLSQSPGLPQVAGDMRCLPFVDATFDWVLNFFTSFGYFESEEENLRVLEEIGRILRPGGRYLIDLFNPDHVLAHLEPDEELELAEGRARIRRWYDRRTRRINKRIQVQTGDRQVRTFLESVRAYRESEVASGLRGAGLELERRFGSFQGEDFQRGSERLIFVGRKPA